ncbi:sortase [Candidatus Gottesmanbacteria bacterium]|nr:sortase [Candidatus Gottesmanbacteria bacterium]
MALYYYVKKTSLPRRRILSIASTLFVFSGLSVITWVIYPILAFELFYAPKFIGLVRPIPETIISEAMENAILGSGDERANAVYASDVDYTKASNWFPKVSPKKLEYTFGSYKVSIPKLSIENALSIVGSEDLSKSLIHWAGSAQPGEYGSAIIFGHSTIPWLYNPKDYKSIFSKLPDLVRGDEIILTANNNVSYKYIVEDMRIVSPDDVSVLEQKYDDSYVTLITCVPPGTYLKRLVVTGRLSKF